MNIYYIAHLTELCSLDRADSFSALLVSQQFPHRIFFYHLWLSKEMLSPNPQTAKWLSEEMLSLNPQRQCVHSMMTQQGDAESESTEKRSAVENPQ